MNIFLMGAFGSGKGTQAKILAEKYDLQILDMGAEQRKEMEKGTPLGKEIEKTFMKGDMALPGPYREILEQWMEIYRDPSKDIIFDAATRTMGQKTIFDEIMKQYGIELEYFFLDVPPEISYQRQLARKDVRTEMNPEVARHRTYEVFPNETMPVIEVYAKEKNLHVIDGTLPIEQVTEKIVEFLKK